MRTSIVVCCDVFGAILHKTDCCNHACRLTLCKTEAVAAHSTLELVTPVPQKAHWLIRKQVRLADQARYHHALTMSSLGSDCQACTAPLLETCEHPEDCRRSCLEMMSARSCVEDFIMAPTKETIGLPLAYWFLPLGENVCCGHFAPLAQGPSVLGE